MLLEFPFEFCGGYLVAVGAFVEVEVLSVQIDAVRLLIEALSVDVAYCVITLELLYDKNIIIVPALLFDDADGTLEQGLKAEGGNRIGIFLGLVAE